MLLPHMGDTPPGTHWRRNSSVRASASASVTSLARMRCDEAAGAVLARVPFIHRRQHRIRRLDGEHRPLGQHIAAARR